MEYLLGLLNKYIYVIDKYNRCVGRGRMYYLISVIIPVYNVEKYLTKCIESVLKQSYQNMEILLIDDGSTDNSGDICDMYANQYSCIKVFHKRNSGLGLTRNYGIKKAVGNYITFVDSDDYIKEDYLLKLITPIINNPKVDTVIGGFVQVDDAGKILFCEKYNQQVYKNKEVRNNLFPRMLGSMPGVRDSIKPMVWNCLYSRELIDRYNLKFVSERQLISEDVVWDSDYYQVSKMAVIINSEEYCYLYNDKSLSKKYDKTRFSRIIMFYSYMEKKLTKIHLDDNAKVRLKKGLFVALSVCILQTNKLTISTSYSEIKRMCRNDLVVSYINTYPLKKLNFKQHFFLFLVKKRFVFALTILSKCGLVHN